jgi:excisionase family DNA binding protein
MPHQKKESVSVSFLENKVLSTSEAAAYLGVSRKTLLKYCRSRQLSFMRFPGGDFRFRESVLEIFMRRCTVSAGAERGYGVAV